MIGAAPVGLLLAAELTPAGARALVIERRREPSAEPKARTPGPLATEALRRRGLGPTLDAGHERALADMRRDRRTARAHFAQLHKIDLAPPDEPARERALIWQPELERLLARYGESLGVEVRRGATLIGLTSNADSVTAAIDSADPMLRRPDDAHDEGHETAATTAATTARPVGGR